MTVSAPMVSGRLHVLQVVTDFRHACMRIGLTRVLSYQMAAAQASGLLDAVLVPWEPAAPPVRLVYDGQGVLPLKLRAVLGCAAPRLKARLAGKAQVWGIDTAYSDAKSSSYVPFDVACPKPPESRRDRSRAMGTAYLDKLNDRQRQAAEFGMQGAGLPPPLLIIAGAGSGKTESRFPAKGTCLAIYSRAVNAEEPLALVLRNHFP